MIGNDTDKEWDYFGRTNPYYGVITHEQYRTETLTAESLHSFFESGRRHIDSVFRIIHHHIDPTFKPANALDFGCGVGRLTIPLAEICQTVTGVDISEAMLAEAEKNCKAQGISNTTFTLGDDSLSKVAGTFDFINSFIVLQHIPCNRGEAIMRRLINLLEPNGIGVLHFTYSRKLPLIRELLIKAYKYIPFLWGIRNILKKKPFREPMMQMNEYNLNNLFRILQETGCHNCYTQFTDHGTYGIMLFFQKRRQHPL